MIYCEVVFIMINDRRAQHW